MIPPKSVTPVKGDHIWTMSGHKKKKEGPDQPRSWAIALAACVINTLLSGISRTTGLFYVALIETYGVSRLQANLPFTVRNVVRNLAGPVVGVIGQRYGPRDVTIVGGVFSALGIILCTFAPNVLWITALWGGMHGLGVALGNTLFQVIVTQYFLKYRASASGMALSGACLGSFVLPILMEKFLLQFGLSGTFLVTGGLILHVLPAAIMLKEPPWIRSRQEKSRNETLTKKIAKPPQVMPIQEESNNHADHLEESSVQSQDESNTWNSCRLKQEVNSPATFINGLSGVDNPVYTGSWMDLYAKILEMPPEEPNPSPREERLRSISISGVSMTIPSPPDDLQVTSVQEGLLTVLRDPMFHLISVSLAAFAMLFDPAITVIVDYLNDKGIREDVAKYFISMLSLGDLIGRLGFGWITDRGYMTIPRFMMLLQVVQGVCFLCLPLCFGFNSLITVLVVYGIMSGANLVMFPILVGKYLKSVQSLAIGCISFLSGVLTFAVPPLIGYFRDRVGSYDGMFLITGGASTVVGFFWLAEPLLVRLGQKLNPPSQCNK